MVPMAEPPSRERSDAARNRVRVLAAAGALFARRGVEAVDMREIAREAGVGVGTLYRRFDDKGALVAAVLGERERELQDALLAGPPPLGPGAPAHERLLAFLAALADFVEGHGELLVVSENSVPGARYRTGSYLAWRLHVVVLLEQLAPAADREYLADAMLAPLAADLYLHQREAAGRSAQESKAQLLALAERLLAERPEVRSAP